MFRCFAWAFPACLVPLSLALAAEDAHQHAVQKVAPTRAICVLTPTEGNRERGVVHLTAQDGHVRVQGKVTGLTPGLHGFHIHEFGDLSSPDGAAAGGHYNPTGDPHGGLHDEHRHIGDLGNIRANDQGVAEFDIKAPGAKLQDLLGRSLVVHADPDDLKSQPAGDSGPRVAVGVIGLAKPPENSAAPASR
jgi:superoxide dismutase, Cu-Zn family